MGYSTPTFRFIYSVAKAVIWPVCMVKAEGVENIPEGPAIVYANHCHWTDPLLIMIAVGKHDQVCMMSKEEIFKNPLLGKIFRAVGCFPVSRGSGDTGAIDTAEQYLREGRKVGIFPEGTRTKTDGSVRPKGGFLRIAAAAQAPLVPVYIERKRKLFRRTTVIFGKPFSVEEVRDEDTGRINYPKAARDLMQRIWDMKEKFLKGEGKAEETV